MNISELGRFPSPPDSPKDGAAAYRYVTAMLQQANIPLRIMDKLIPNRLMLYGEDGWGIVITPTLIFTESETGADLHVLKSPINLRDKNWQGRGLDWDLSYTHREIPEELISPALGFVISLTKKAAAAEQSQT